MKRLTYLCHVLKLLIKKQKSNLSFQRLLLSSLRKRLSCRRGAARRSMLVEILSTAAQLYEKCT